MHALHILIPCFDDWEALLQLRARISHVLMKAGLHASITVVDDGSVNAAPNALMDGPEPLRLISLNRNMGHQKAIAVGLCDIYANQPEGPVLVLDADGEDNPEALPELLRTLENGGVEAAVAQRARRSEGFVFRLGYWFYQKLFRLLTGKQMDFGNFSLLSWRMVERLVHMHELWLSFPVALYKSRLPFARVPTARDKRLAGQSTMRHLGLVYHGMRMISVYASTVLVRTMSATFALSGLLALALGVILWRKFALGLTHPAWVIELFAMLIIIATVVMVQLVATTLVMSFVAERHGDIPLKGYAQHIAAIDE